jgi:glycosyltransferase involved in cell wall biosynthesis
MARVLMFGSLPESLITFRGPLLKQLVETGHETFACAPNASKKVKDILADMGVAYINITLDRTGLNLIQDMLSVIKLVKTFKVIKPEVFLGYTIKPVIYGSIAAQLAGIPKIFSLISGLGYTFSGTDFKAKMLKGVVKNLYSLALGSNNKIFFQNQDNLELFKSYGFLSDSTQAVLVNGSGVDIDMYIPKPFPRNLSFLLLARLIKEKGIYEYAEAAKDIKQRYPSVRFSMAGIVEKHPSAISKQALLSWAESGAIDYLGALRDVRPAIENSSVYVLPSFYPEGQPRSVLEAMAMGRPVITTDTPGCRETVHHGRNGFLIPPRDADALIQAMEYFINRPDDIATMGMASRQIAIEKYDVHKVNKVMLTAMGLY